MTEIVENGIRYLVDFENGQKTGFFLDQKYNRAAAARIAPGRSVLDCFTHTGSFGLNCAKAGAKRVRCAWTCQRERLFACARENAARNGLAVEYRGGQRPFDLLPSLTPGEFDYIILDPPAFTKSGKTVKNAERGLQGDQLPGHEGAAPGRVPGHLLLLALYDGRPVPEGCSKAPPADAQVELRLVEARAQGPDHPILWNVPETDYLKFYIFQVV